MTLSIRSMLSGIFVVVGLSTSAQEWSPYVPGQVSYYEEHDPVHSQNVLLKKFIDTSFQRSNHTAYYFHSGLSEDCQAFQIESDHFELEFDSLVKRNGRFIYYAHGDSQQFFHSALPGYSWKIPALSESTSQVDSIQITLDSLGESSQAGIVDSVRFYSALAIKNGQQTASPINGANIILSKHHGFWRSINLMPFLNGYAAGIHKHIGYQPIQLTGFTRDHDTVGTTLPPVQSFFDYHPGDILKWKEEFQANPPGPNDYIKIYRDSITQVEGDPTEVKIWFERKTLHDGNISNSSKTKVFDLQLFRSIVSSNSDYLHPYHLGFEGELTFASHFRKTKQDQCATLHFDGMTVDENCYVAQVPDILRSYTICQRQGLKQFHERIWSGTTTLQLIGYQSSEDTVGNVLPLGSAYSQSPRGPVFSLTPNPANEVINIVLSSNDGKGEYRIMNTVGKLMKRGIIRNDAAIGISHLPAGIYIIAITINGKRAVRKFVRE